MSTCVRNLPQHFNGCVCVVDPAITAEADVVLTNAQEAAVLADDENQTDAYMAFMERTMGTPPEPETGYCAECGDLWIEDPHGSPGVKVHYDPESSMGIDHAADEDHTPVPEDDEMENRPYSSDAFPNGRCGACGFGLDEHGSCYQHDCSAFHAGSPLADIGSMTSGENLEQVTAADLAVRDRILHDGTEFTVTAVEQGKAGPGISLNDTVRGDDIDPDMAVFRFERMCERHGGEWGSDETCERCTTDDGTVRDFDKPGSLGKCWSCAEDGYDTEADTGDDNGPLCEGCAERRAQDETDAATDLDESEDEVVHEFQVIGSSSSFAVTYSQTEDEPYSFYRDGTFVGSFDYDGWSTDHAAIEQAALRVFPVEAPAATCTDETGHLPGQDHRWQDCPTYHDDDN